MTVIQISESLAMMHEGSKVEDSIVRDVKIIGFESVNNRTYTPDCLRNAARLYEGCKVNLDHPQKERPTDPRSILHRFGTFKNVRFVENKGVFGDLSYNPAHQYAPTFKWFAENQPNAIGFSHNAAGRGGTSKDGKLVVEAITAVRAVDLVADPATTRSLFESEHPAMTEEAVAILTDDKTDNVEKLRLVQQLLERNDNPEDKKKETGMDWKDITLASLRENRADLLEEIRNGITQEFTEAAEREKKAREHCKQLVTDAKLAPGLITDIFMEQVYQAPNDEKRKALIEDRRKLTVGQTPKSKETSLQEHTGGATGSDKRDLTMKEFVKDFKRAR